MEVHISTQINITNIETVKFYAMFADTLVLSRELSLGQVKKITEQIVKSYIAKTNRYRINDPEKMLPFMPVDAFLHGKIHIGIHPQQYEYGQINVN